MPPPPQSDPMGGMGVWNARQISLDYGDLRFKSSPPLPSVGGVFIAVVIVGHFLQYCICCASQFFSGEIALEQ